MGDAVFYPTLSLHLTRERKGNSALLSNFTSSFITATINQSGSNQHSISNVIFLKKSNNKLFYYKLPISFEKYILTMNYSIWQPTCIALLEKTKQSALEQ